MVILGENDTAVLAGEVK